MQNIWSALHFLDSSFLSSHSTFSTSVSPCLSSTMLDLSQASVEYVCKNVTSPNIARRFGHKLNDGGGLDRQYVRATSQVGRFTIFSRVVIFIFYSHRILTFNLTVTDQGKTYSDQDHPLQVTPPHIFLPIITAIVDK